MIRRLLQLLTRETTKPVLGRWALKHNCKSEEIIVHQTNMDHCGDIICGDPKKYKDFTDKKKNTYP